MIVGRAFKQTCKLFNQQQARIVFATQGLNQGIKEADPQLNEIIQKEIQRQKSTINLIPSENYTSLSAKQAVGSIMNSKYSEGLPLNRYYGGNQFIDKMEILCQNRALELFGLNPTEWGINVQAHSLTPANFHVLTGLLQNHDRVMSLSIEHGGHLSHGQNIKRERLSAGSVYFEVLNYGINEKSGLIDYDKLEEQAKYFLPKVIFGGADLYSRKIDYERLRKICDSIGATLVVDLGQVSGLVATKILPDPFKYADIVTSATHKSLRGPRGALVFYKQGVKGVDKKGNEIKYDFKNKIENAIFPGSQGGPHNHTIAGIAVALKEAQQQNFKEYQQQVVKNAQVLYQTLSQKQYNILTNGTDNHLVLVDFKSKGINTLQLIHLLEQVHIDTYRSTLPNGKETFISSFLALGTHPMTTRGCTENDFKTIAEFIDRGALLLKELSTKQPAPTSAQEIQKWAEQNVQSNSSLQKLQQEAASFVKQFEVPSI
ncbi:hypothetical protein ABPG74_010435 [Tetrahymena malaccensis]